MGSRDQPRVRERQRTKPLIWRRETSPAIRAAIRRHTMMLQLLLDKPINSRSSALIDIPRTAAMGPTDVVIAIPRRRPNI